MIKIAIVEDEKAAAKTLEKCLLRFGEEYSVQFAISFFSGGLDFLDGYKPDTDLVFMDIQMADIDGIETSKRLRQIAPKVGLVFVTSMAQYAINGYEYNALDFIVKPLDYYSFRIKLQRILPFVEKNEKYIMISANGEKRRIDVNSIIYVEVLSHNVIFHTENGTLDSIGTLKNIESALADCNFERCNSCFLVNLRFVSGVVGSSVLLNAGGAKEEELRISRQKRKQFLQRLADYYGGGKTSD